MSHYTLSDSALRDIDEIWEYVARDNIEAADRLIDGLFERILLLAHTPHLGAVFRPISDTVRHTSVGNYVIFYEPHEAEVRVLRVLQGSRDFVALFQNEPLEDS